MKSINKILLTLSASLVLSACSSSNINQDENLLKKQVETNLTKSINEISVALNELQLINRGVKGVTDTKTAIGNTVAGRIVAKTGEEPKTAHTLGGKVEDKSAKVETKLTVDTKKVDTQSSKGREAVLSTALDQKVRLNWDGEASDLLNSLSKKIGFNFVEEGNKQSLPVKVSAKNQTIKDIFGLIDSQTSGKADIKISSINKTIKLIYTK